MKACSKNATVTMTDIEAELWFDLLLGAPRYLEWGTGGSTVLASCVAMHQAESKLFTESG